VFIQINDIDMTAATADGGAFYNDGEGWEPIGNAVTGYTDSMFTGTYDGNGNKIIGLKIDRKSSTHLFVGLFGDVGGGKIKNLGIKGGSFRGESTSAGSSSGIYIGSIAGWVWDGEITNCYNTGNVFSTLFNQSSAGGIVGYCSSFYKKCTITNCYNTGQVSSYAPGSSNAGGIAGESGGSIITNCFNTGNVSSTSEGTSFFAASPAGGIAGHSAYDVISDSYNTGNISSVCTGGSPSHSGGIAGRSCSVIKNCYNTGYIYSTSPFGPSAGGVAGYICWIPISNDDGPIETGVINNCYNTGGISAVTSSSYVPSGNEGQAGGIVGINSGDNYGGTTITNSYWNSDVFPDGIGVTYNASTITNIAAKTSAEMKAPSFIDLLNQNRGGNAQWCADSFDINGGYPVFEHQLKFMPPRILSAAISDNGEVTIILNCLKDSGEVLIAAVYDNRNRLLALNNNAIKTETEASDFYEYKISADISSADAKKIKVMWWNGLNTMQPLCVSKGIKYNGNDWLDIEQITN